MSDDEFFPDRELKKIKLFRQMAKRRRSRFSKLMPFRRELVALRRAGATIADLVMWLRQRKRLRVSGSTVSRYLKKLPELTEEPNG